ncbi:acyltransferase [Geodermatophilus sp. SYSU D01180]
MLRWGGVTVSPSAAVAERCQFISGIQVELRDQVFVNAGCVFDAWALITLGAGVRVGPGVHFLTSTHEVGGPEMRAAELTHAAVHVGEGTWIGAGAIVLPGVRIAPGCVIGAGAVVTHDTEADGLYLGVPARRVKDLPTAQPAQAVYQTSD